MEETHPHRVVAWWASGRTGIAKASGAPNAIHFTAPPEFGGVEGRWTPEDLFLGAVASCYTTTFRALAENSRFDYTDLEVTADGSVQKIDPSYEFSEIVIGANLTISCESEQERAFQLLRKAGELCPVARAITVPQRLEPHVQIHRAVPVG
jgi:organic hydroperoxide reductase OsmC/OhrA